MTLEPHDRSLTWPRLAGLLAIIVVLTFVLPSGAVQTLVNIAALKTGGTVWVLSAGPDGIVQTPFLAPNGPVADDRAAPVR